MQPRDPQFVAFACAGRAWIPQRAPATAVEVTSGNVAPERSARVLAKLNRIHNVHPAGWAATHVFDIDRYDPLGLRLSGDCRCDDARRRLVLTSRRCAIIEPAIHEPHREDLARHVHFDCADLGPYASGDPLFDVSEGGGRCL
jgi:hypothetical protein